MLLYYLKICLYSETAWAWSPTSPPRKSMSPCLQSIYQQIKISNWYINLSRFTLWLICSIKETTYSACFALPIRNNTPTEKLCIKVLQIKSKCCKSLFVLRSLKIRRFHLHIFYVLFASVWQQHLFLVHSVYIPPYSSVPQTPQTNFAHEINKYLFYIQF